MTRPAGTRDIINLNDQGLGDRLALRGRQRVFVP